MKIVRGILLQMASSPKSKTPMFFRLPFPFLVLSPPLHSFSSSLRFLSHFPFKSQFQIPPPKMETMQVPKDKLSGASGDGDGALNVTVKLENEQEEFENNGTMSFLPKPLEDLHQMGPPPFLTKTYEMVEDPETDPIVSWGDKMDSFVVWEPHQFGSNLLPKYFKHSNLSSFIRQLNTYGFRKVHLDRWEFANPGFQKGKKHLLKTIKRRNHGANNNNHAKLHLEREIEVEKLKKEQDALTVEIDNLKQQQHNSDKCLAAMEERVRCVEWKQREFIVLIAKAMRKTPFFQHLIHKYKQKKALSDGGMLKKRRLSSSEAFEDSFLAKDLTQYGDHHCHQDGGTVAMAISTGERLKKRRLVSSDILEGSFVDKGGIERVIHEGEVAIESEIHSLLSSPPMDIGSTSLPDQKSGLSSETSSPDMSSGNYLMWEKLMEDDVICEDDEEEALADNKSKFVIELEDLIAKPPTWVPLANVDEVACPIGTNSQNKYM